MSLFQMLFSAQGRIRRRDYWLYSIALGIFWMVIEYIGYQVLVGGDPKGFFTALAGWMTFKPTPFNLFILAMIIIGQWPGICLSAKRWHDRNRTGWLAGLVIVVSLGSSVSQVYYGPTGAHLNWPVYGLTAIISLGVSIWQFVECGCLDGTKGPNKYGPSPKGIGGQDAVF
mgnify:FL=1